MPAASFCAVSSLGAIEHWLLRKRERAEPAAPAPAQAHARSIERDVFARLDAVGEAGLDFGKRDRRRQQDAATCR